MAQKIQAWVAYGPRLDLAESMSAEEFIENIVAATNQSRGSVLAVLAEADVQIEAGLKNGRIVHMPNRTYFEPVGKRDGQVDIAVRPNPDLEKRVNAGFRGQWINAQNIGKTEAEIIALWNSANPGDPIAP